MSAGIERASHRPDASTEAGFTRRTFMKHGATGATAAGLTAMWAPNAFASGGLGGTLPGALNPRSPELMLINRLTRGYTEEEEARLVSLGGFDQYRNESLYPTTPIDNSALDAILAPGAFYLNANPAYIFGLNPGVALALVDGLKNATILRSILSRNQPQERMMELWNDHFNTYSNQEGQFLLKTTWEREVLQPHALGCFWDLARKTTEGASMLLYLDQAYSKAPAPNENYAREFLELHTIGQTNPYTGAANYVEADVLAAAQAFTGYSYDDDQTGGVPANPATFFYFKWKQGYHVNGPKTFLGVTVPQTNNAAEAQFVITLLLTHPETATQIAHKMARWLVSYDPSATVVNPAASLYTTTCGDIKAMMAALLTSGNMTAAGQAPAGFFERRPSDFVYALARALRISFPLDKLALVGELRRMGNAPMEWPAPDGYKHDPGAWIGSVFTRWEFANKLLASPTDTAHDADRLDGIGISDADLQALVGPVQVIPDITDRIDKILTGGVMTANERCVLTEYMEFWFPIRNPFLVLREAFALGASCPTFQYY